MTVKEILAKWLKDNGYDGLTDNWCECACGMDDFLHCSEGFYECRPGYKGPDPDGDCDFLIYPTKEAADAATKGIKT